MCYLLWSSTGHVLYATIQYSTTIYSIALCQTSLGITETDVFIAISVS